MFEMHRQKTSMLHYYTKRGRDMDKNLVAANEPDNMMQDNSGTVKTVSAKHVCIFLVVVILMMGVLMVQQYQHTKIKEEHAYASAALICLQEEHLLLKYGLIPSQVGLGDLRDAWIDNPCYETANTYTDALSEVIDKLEQKTTPQKFDTVITAGVAV